MKNQSAKDLIQVLCHPYGPTRGPSADRCCAICHCTKSGTPVWRIVDGRRLCNKCGLRTSRIQKKSAIRTNHGLSGDASSGVKPPGDNDRQMGVSGPEMQDTSTLPNNESDIGISAAGQTRDFELHENLWFTAAQLGLISFNPVTTISECDSDIAISQFPPINATNLLHINKSSLGTVACRSNHYPQDVNWQNTHPDASDSFQTSGSPLETAVHRSIGITQGTSGVGSIHFLLPTLFPDWVGWYHRFYRHTTEVHGNVLRMNSSVYVATETFLYDHAGETYRLTAYAVLKEQYDTTNSPYHGSLSTFEAASHDLVFDFVTIPVSGYPDELDDWLDVNGQSLAQHIHSPRIMSAIWDLSSLPVGPHRPDSATFRYLTRELHSIETSSGLRSVPIVKSGSSTHNFRSVHQMVILLKHIKIDRNSRLKILMEQAPKLRSACVRSSQEWLITVFDEAIKLRGMQAQLNFLEANKAYMWNIIGHHRRSYQEADIDEISLISPCPCPPSTSSPFDVLLARARGALDRIFFSISHMSHYPCFSPPRFPTHDQLRDVAIVGDVLYKMYFACNLLNEQQRIQHNIATWKNFAEERAQLFRRSNAKLIWNYLPVESIEVASAKLDRVLITLHPSTESFTYSQGLLPI